MIAPIARATISKIIKTFSLSLLVFIFSSPVIISDVISKEINIYSHRQPFLINPFLELFTKETGIKTNIVYAKKGLAERLQAEGKNTPADIILTVDISRLHVYADKNLLAPISSEKLEKNIPTHLRSKNNTWFALSKRNRVIAASSDRVSRGSVNTYEDLIKPENKGKVCSRPGSHVYNRALLSSIIVSKGIDQAEDWAKLLVNNLARRPQGNDRAQLKAIYQGECDLAIINHYYFGKLKYSDIEEQRKWMSKVYLIFPNQNQGDRGVHVNISGGGVVKYSKNKELAIKLLEFLTEKKAQKLYSEINFEFPVNPNVTPGKKLSSWEKFREDNVDIAKIAEYSNEAQIIIDKVGW